jgi:16S rRNA (cytosine1402-N4)-methyltransferase
LTETHLPVLPQAVLEGLAIRPDGVYVDATFGRGGHSAQILARLGPKGKLLAIDRDPEAVAVGRSWRDERFEIVHARFDELHRLLEERAIDAVHGVLLDLGVSSPQLDDPTRGFSFKSDGPLDMRMDPTQGMSARQWLAVASEEEIKEVLKRYGQERLAVQIAKAIVARRRDAGDAAFETTRQLAGLVARTVGKFQKRSALGKDPATRTFQALRIHVNQELAHLARALEQSLNALAPAGRLVVIAFHSLEDRMVKQFIAQHASADARVGLEHGAFEPPVARGQGARRRAPLRSGSMQGPQALHGLSHEASDAQRSAPRLRAVARVLPDEAESERNPRARSAVLRVAERVGASGMNATGVVPA